MAMAGWFLAFTGMWWLPLMLVEAEDQQGGGCSAKKCGTVSISDPFWLTDRNTGRSCGSDPYPNFDVACLNNSSIPALRSSIPLNQGFEILDISYEERSIYAVDLGKLNVLNSRDKCRAVFYNTSVKLTPPFKVAPVNLNLILYNCTEVDGAAAAARRQTSLARTRVRCENEWEVLVRVGVPPDVTGNYSGYALDGCSAVVVPVPGSSAGANASDYQQLMKDGFLLTWDLPDLLATPPAGRKGTSKKIMLIAMTSAAGALLFTCIYVLVWPKNGERLCLLLCKKTSSNTEKNYEAMIVSYGSLAPKRYMYSEVMKITSSRNDQLGKEDMVSFSKENYMMAVLLL